MNVRGDILPESSMPENLDDQIRSLLSAGRKIEAIKVYREATGAGLAGAKNAVEAIERHVEPTASDAPHGEFEQQLLALVERGEKIMAIKLYREQTGAGLKEAKDAVEALAARRGTVAPRGAGCFGVILLLLTAMAVAGWGIS